ncbi:MAG: hypothetical protein AAB874_04355, partial [Patescibacteria group bacterium]
MNVLRKLRSILFLFPQNWEIILTFNFFILIALFFGDGLQPFVDVFAAGVLSVLGWYALKTKQPTGSISRP